MTSTGPGQREPSGSGDLGRAFTGQDRRFPPNGREPGAVLITWTGDEIELPAREVPGSSRRDDWRFTVRSDAQ
ncbi:MAG TPA: hypothetical protein VFT20_11195, partial [Candidatus Limnocylindrales bacterium]|nr:hypothetical protein [Candidatus Limnocylindrales bacterium]